MPQCPQCTKPLRELVRRCPSCQADLDLLVDFVSHLQGGLQRAENLTRAGELGQAVWAYLEILEVDPDNAAAKKQVSQVATAVRQFDLSTSGRKWLNGVQDNGVSAKKGSIVALVAIGALTLALSAFVLGYLLGGANTSQADDEQQPLPLPAKTLGA